MSVISISSGVSRYSGSEDFRPAPMNSAKTTAIAEKTLTYEEKEELKNFEDAVNNLSKEDKDAVEEYLEETLEKMRNGETDTVALAANAPDALKAALEAEGIDLSSVLGNISSHAPESNGAVDVNVDENVSVIQQITSTLDKSDQADANNFMQDVMKKIHDGEFDIDEIMKDAPTALTKALEEQKADLKTMLEAMNNKFLSFAASTDYSTVLFSKLSNLSIDLSPDDKEQA